MAAGVAPLDLAAAVEAVALVLDGQQVPVVELAGRGAYSFESVSAAVTVTVHLGSARGVDQVADLLGLGEGAVSYGEELYGRGGHGRPGVYVSLYGPPHQPAAVAGVAS